MAARIRIFVRTLVLIGAVQAIALAQAAEVLAGRNRP